MTDINAYDIRRLEDTINDNKRETKDAINRSIQDLLYDIIDPLKKQVDNLEKKLAPEGAYLSAYVEHTKNLADNLLLLGSCLRSIYEIENEMADLERSLTPPDGWEGKNVETRKLAKETTLSNHQHYSSLLAALREHTAQKYTLEYNVKSLSKQTSALEILLSFADLEE